MQCRGGAHSLSISSFSFSPKPLCAAPPLSPAFFRTTPTPSAHSRSSSPLCSRDKMRRAVSSSRGRGVGGAPSAGTADRRDREHRHKSYTTRKRRGGRECPFYLLGCITAYTDELTIAGARCRPRPLTVYPPTTRTHLPLLRRGPQVEVGLVLHRTCRDIRTYVHSELTDNLLSWPEPVYALQSSRSISPVR